MGIKEENKNTAYQKLLEEIEETKNSPLTSEEQDRRVDSFHKKLFERARVNDAVKAHETRRRMNLKYCSYCGTEIMPRKDHCSNCNKLV